MIPKIIHQVWIGNKPMPEKLLRWSETIRRCHPDWDYKLWTDKDEFPHMICEKAWTLNSHVVVKADILRYEVVYRYGGVYLDMDFECCRNFEPLLEGVKSFSAVQDSDGLVNPAILGSEPHDFAFQKIIFTVRESLLRANVRGDQYQHLDITGPNFLARACRAVPEFHVFEKKYFFPYIWTEKFVGFEAYPEAYAAHHWAGSWCT